MTYRSIRPLAAAHCRHAPVLRAGPLPAHRLPPPIKAFTILELLTVIAIMALVVTLSIPAVTGMMGGLNQSQAADTVVGQLKYANQIALTRNKPVEVRFYKFTDPNIPGSGNSFRAMQSWIATSPVTKVQRLPGTMIISSDSSLSDMLGNPQTPPSGQTIPSLPSGYTYCSFQFRPDGSTTLPSGANNHFLTVVSETAKGSPPPNFATIQIEPVTGGIRVYRP